MSDTCKSCGHAAPGHESHCAWGAPAATPRKSTIRAAIDPGSRWIAVTITRDDGPESPLRFSDARAFEVGHWVEFPEPRVKFKKPKSIEGAEQPPEPYTVTGEHVLTEADASAAATEIVTYLLSYGVDEVATEHVRNMHGMVGAVGTALLKSSGVYTRIVDRLELLGVRVRYVLASTWRARLNPIVKASMSARGLVAKGVLISRSTGSVLDPVFADLVAGWPGAHRWTDKQIPHIRDATGLALACYLPPLPVRARGAVGSRGPRARRVSKAQPRGARARAEMKPILLAKYRATDRAREQRYRDRDQIAIIEVRADAGCACRLPGESLRGRHKRACPMHVVKVSAARTCRCGVAFATHARPLCQG